MVGREEQAKVLRERLQGDIGYTFQSTDLLTYALTHCSATSGERPDYERLEFLGDAVLDLAIADLLLQRHPHAREGELSKMRAALVNTQSLAEIAKELELGDCIILSRAERAQRGHERASILADVLEALIGAIYRESSFEKAKHVVGMLFGDRIIHVEPRDPKTELQEALHQLEKEAPEYLLEYTEGPEHAPRFISIVQVEGKILGRGEGGTKKASQQEAARIALEELGRELPKGNSKEGEPRGSSEVGES